MSLNLSLIRDDGAVVYLNGEESVRSNMTSREVNFRTLALNAVTGDDEFKSFEYTLDPDLLVDGTNVMAVEIHQASSSSTDMGFDLKLTATRKKSAEPYSILSNPLELTIEGDMTINASLKKNNDIPDLKINEILASNSNGIRDEFGENDDWIEIYNAGENGIDLGGLYITDSLGDQDKWMIPGTDSTVTNVEPGGFIVLWADNEPEQGSLHLGFKLSKSGEQVGLFQLLEESMILLDSMTYSTQTTDISLARSPDATGPWTVFIHPTPGAHNFSLGENIRNADLLAIRVYPNPTSGMVKIDGIPPDFFNSGKHIQLTVLNYNGRILRQDKVPSLQSLETDLSEFNAGLYLIRISAGDQYFTRQVLLMK